MARTTTVTTLAGRAGGAKAAAKAATLGFLRRAAAAREADRAREEERARRRHAVRASLMRERYARSSSEESSEESGAESGAEGGAESAEGGAARSLSHVYVRQALRVKREHAMRALAAVRDALEVDDREAVERGIRAAMMELGASDELDARLD